MAFFNPFEGIISGKIEDLKFDYYSRKLDRLCAKDNDGKKSYEYDIDDIDLDDIEDMDDEGTSESNEESELSERLKGLKKRF